MKPYYEDEAVTVWHGDCLEILPTLPRVDLVLTDPPYGLGDRWQGGGWSTKPLYADVKKWDCRPSDELIGACVAAGSNAIIWGGNYFTLPPSRGFLLWMKIPALPTMADAEYAWTTFDHVAKAFACPPSAKLGTRSGDREHPTEKPHKLMCWCIEYASARSEVSSIVDPFMGGGTTLRAAKDLGRKAIGIEIEEKYCEIAAQRMAQEVLEFG